MTSLCTIHNVEMEERVSKTKFNEDGSAKTYFAHIANGKMCFGEGMGKGNARPAPTPTPTPATVANGFDKNTLSMMAMNAMKCASELTAAEIAAKGAVGDTETRLKELFDKCFALVKGDVQASDLPF